ncbi:MAG: extracellular solute-binding protein family 1 [Myxococcales bacterium]|nr:extracellular solute-binding protein family 1 [Myxococcales bacterium]
MKSPLRSALFLFAPLAVLALTARPAEAAAPLNLVTTTSTQDSGLLDKLVPAAEKALGVHIRVIAVGSGEALELAERGEADVLVAHSPAAEEKVVAAGHLVERSPLMWNRFVIVGPATDAAKLSGLTDPADAFRRIRASGAAFISRGDESGTHKKEQELWKAAQLEPKDAHVIATGQGQGETLQVANQRAAYTLCDSATWAKMKPAGLVVLVDARGKKTSPTVPSLANPYHVMRENEVKHPATNVEAAKRFLTWIKGPDAATIMSAGGFTLGEPPTN